MSLVGLIFLVRIRRTSVSGLLNVAVIQWRRQPCAIQSNLGHVTGSITMEQILSEAIFPFMERTDPGAKCFHKHFVKRDVLYIFLYISGHIWPLLRAVAKSSMLHVVVIKGWVARVLALFSTLLFRSVLSTRFFAKMQRSRFLTLFMNEMLLSPKVLTRL